MTSTDFNPRVPCGTRPSVICNENTKRSISIHGSRVGPDKASSVQKHQGSHFNPRVPCGTRRVVFACWWRWMYFNPRVPCGTRLFAILTTCTILPFQSTGPVWDPTLCHEVGNNLLKFQSTGPVWDPTSSSCPRFYRVAYFNPRVPCGTRRQSNFPRV